MKSKMILSPLAFALTAVIASGGAYAAGGNHNGGNHNGGNNTTGASAVVNDTQMNYGNNVQNDETKNTATIDGSLNGAAGNVGANVAAGDNNQQANAAAIATADAFFVFGFGEGLQANASIGVTQQAYDNYLSNYGTQNNASVVDSGNDVQGSVGINVAAGNFNQQKNDMAIASSEQAFTAEASVNVLQESSGNDTHNNVGDVYEVNDGLQVVSSGFGWFPPQTPQTPVVNNASLSNSLNNASGNVGVNIAAGGGNQQSNTLAIAAGCNACIAQ
ncbi:hypothetical protein [Pseudomonas sp.]|uniref:hypothetical protein n=1 Tax=Pseudomonas sp. TaxID=306 RepID=UPI00299E693F|nr:hypothetical protein [Pseudomonas sp.]MDX1367831.1 hypothetical protein [Pseudomonas sp.]